MGSNAKHAPNQTVLTTSKTAGQGGSHTPRRASSPPTHPLLTLAPLQSPSTQHPGRPSYRMSPSPLCPIQSPLHSQPVTRSGSILYDLSSLHGHSLFSPSSCSRMVLPPQDCWAGFSQQGPRPQGRALCSHHALLKCPPQKTWINSSMKQQWTWCSQFIR